MRSRACPVAIAALLCLLGCGRQRDADFKTEAPYQVMPPGAPQQQNDRGAVPPSTPPANGSPAPDESGAPQEENRGGGGPPGAPAPIPAPVERQIIRSGQIAIRVGSLDTAEAALARIAAGGGGYIANSARTREAGNTLSGTMELRFPSGRFDTVTAAVRHLGEVLSESLGTSDVTAEYIDLNARLKTQQELEARLLKLLQDRTGKLGDVIEVEGKLAEVRTAIESVQGRLRYLSNQVSMSTLTVNMVEPGAIGSSETETFGGRMGHAIEQGIDGLIGTLGVLITLAIALIPFFAIGFALYYFAIRPWLRRRKQRAKEQGASGTT